MTSRQREFCRHYLTGIPASEAAKRAGYATCLAETNAADILKSKAVAAYLQRHREARAVLNIHDFRAVVQKLLNIIDLSKDDRDITLAAREIRAYMRLQNTLTPEFTAPLTDNQASFFEDSRAFSEENGLQLLDNQESPSEKNIDITPIPESDTLYTGQPAFDLKPYTLLALDRTSLKYREDIRNALQSQPPPD
jgi:hypothetical protein